MSTKMVKIKQKLPLSGDNQNEKFERNLQKKHYTEDLLEVIKTTVFY